MKRTIRRAWRIVRPLRVPLVLAVLLAFSPVCLLLWLLGLPVLGIAARRTRP